MMSLASFAIAVIGLIVAVLSFMVGDDDNKPVRIGCGLLSLVLTLAFVGLGLFSLFGNFFPNIAQVTNISGTTINLGSGWTPSNISPAGNDTYRVYSHYPQNNLRYVSVYVDDDLVKVEKVCSTSSSDITYLFDKRTDISNAQNLPYYQSDLITVDGCRIDFTVIDNHGGNMGIDILEVEH